MLDFILRFLDIFINAIVMNTFFNLPIIAYILAINILIVCHSDCWKILVKLVCVDAMEVTPIDYFPVHNLTYDPFVFHTQNTHSNR